MAWYQILSFFFTNGLRIFLGLYLVATLFKLSGNMGKATALSVCATVCITVLYCFPIQQFYLVGAEIIALTLIVSYLFAAQPRMCLFLTFFYEITVALWEFIISAGLGVVFQSERFLNMQSLEYTATVWIVRLFMLGIAFITVKERNSEGKQPSRIITGVAIAGLFGVVFLSGQNTITINDDKLTTWGIFSMLILVAILIFNINRQYEMEKTIAQLEKEKMLC